MILELEHVNVGVNVNVLINRRHAKPPYFLMIVSH
jgi:hypothetical protein